MTSIRNTPRRLLVPLTDGFTDRATLRAIGDVARSAGSVVRLLYIRPLPSDPRSGPAAHETQSPSAPDLVACGLGDVSVERVERVGDLETAILDEAAAWRADLVALSAGDRTWLSRAVHAGTAAKAFRESGIPALLYMPPREAGPGACGAPEG